MAQIIIDTVRQDMSYLLGEDSLPSPWPTRRDTFIQRSLEDIYRIYDFEMNKVTFTLALVSGNAVLPSNMRATPDVTDVRVIHAGGGNDDIYRNIPYDQQDGYNTGDMVWWMTQNSDGTLEFNSWETATPYVTIQYELIAPTINSSIATPFPSSMVIAEKALVYERRAQDKDADVSQEMALWRADLEDVIGAESRNQPYGRAIGIQEKSNRYTGQPSAGDKDYAFERLNP